MSKTIFSFETPWIIPVAEGDQMYCISKFPRSVYNEIKKVYKEKAPAPPKKPVRITLSKIDVTQQSFKDFFAQYEKEHRFKLRVTVVVYPGRNFRCFGADVISAKEIDSSKLSIKKLQNGAIQIITGIGRWLEIHRFGNINARQYFEDLTSSDFTKRNALVKVREFQLLCIEGNEKRITEILTQLRDGLKEVFLSSVQKSIAIKGPLLDSQLELFDNFDPEMNAQRLMQAVLDNLESKKESPTPVVPESAKVVVENEADPDWDKVGVVVDSSKEVKEITV